MYNSIFNLINGSDWLPNETKEQFFWLAKPFWGNNPIHPAEFDNPRLIDPSRVSFQFDPGLFNIHSTKWNNLKLILNPDKRLWQPIQPALPPLQGSISSSMRPRAPISEKTGSPSKQAKPQKKEGLKPSKLRRREATVRTQKGPIQSRNVSIPLLNLQGIMGSPAPKPPPQTERKTRSRDTSPILHMQSLVKRRSPSPPPPIITPMLQPEGMINIMVQAPPSPRGTSPQRRRRMGVSLKTPPISSYYVPSPASQEEYSPIQTLENPLQVPFSTFQRKQETKQKLTKRISLETRPSYFPRPPPSLGGPPSLLKPIHLNLPTATTPPTTSILIQGNITPAVPQLVAQQNIPTPLTPLQALFQLPLPVSPSVPQILTRLPRLEVSTKTENIFSPQEAPAREKRRKSLPSQVTVKKPKPPDPIIQPETTSRVRAKRLLSEETIKKLKPPEPAEKKTIKRSYSIGALASPSPPLKKLPPRIVDVPSSASLLGRSRSRSQESMSMILPGISPLASIVGLGLLEEPNLAIPPGLISPSLQSTPFAVPISRSLLSQKKQKNLFLERPLISSITASGGTKRLSNIDITIKESENAVRELLEGGIPTQKYTNLPATKPFSERPMVSHADLPFLDKGEFEQLLAIYKDPQAPPKTVSLAEDVLDRYNKMLEEFKKRDTPRSARRASKRIATEVLEGESLVKRRVRQKQGWDLVNVQKRVLASINDAAKNVISDYQRGEYQRAARLPNPSLIVDLPSTGLIPGVPSIKPKKRQQYRIQRSRSVGSLGSITDIAEDISALTDPLHHTVAEIEHVEPVFAAATVQKIQEQMKQYHKKKEREKKTLEGRGKKDITSRKATMIFPISKQNYRGAKKHKYHEYAGAESLSRKSANRAAVERIFATGL